MPPNGMGGMLSSGVPLITTAPPCMATGSCIVLELAPVLPRLVGLVLSYLVWVVGWRREGEKGR